MITKNIKQILLAGTLCCGATISFSACSDWDDHYDGSAESSAGSSTTLWQQLKSNDQLSDFCEVLENTKVYRMHKKTQVSYADLLKGGQSFTVLAPVNNTFNKDSLLSLVETVAGDSSVEKSFVQNHLSRSLSSVKSDSVRMMMLNWKRHNIVDGKVGGFNISSANNHTRNGIFHVVDHAMNYNRNLYELFCDDPELKPIGDNLRRFNEDIFDPDASVSNGIVEGVPVYIDSVVYERNRLLEQLGLLKEEDSTYTAVAPTAEGWAKAWEEASKYFQFDETKEKRDSLHQFFTARALMQDAIFNMSEQHSIEDSLISVPYRTINHTYSKGKKTYNVFYKPFAEGGILNGAQPIACSNGTLYKTQEWPFTPEQTFFKEIYVEGETVYLIQDYDKCMYNVETLSADTISEGKYLKITPLKATDNWSATFQVNNTLSGSYDIFAVILPKTVLDPNSTDLLPNKFKANINYVDLAGKDQSFACKIDGKAEFQSDPLRVDTVMLAENFQFPSCNYQQDNTRFSIKLTCSITTRQTSQYSREMYLDCIYLRPHTSKSEEQ